MSPWLEHLELDTLAGQIEAACLLEVAARKPGNVHPEASFEDLSFEDFVQSAKAAAPILAGAESKGVGSTIEAAVRATRDAVGKNTNLGIILLLAPLAAVPKSEPLQTGVARVLNELAVEDSRLIYRAIQLAQPGGMGTAPEQDLSSVPTLPPRSLMQLAADRDSIARLWSHGFEDLFSIGLPAFLHWQQSGCDWEHIVIGCALSWMSQIPDTLIARKLGASVAMEASHKAQLVLESGWPRAQQSERALREFDEWLRGDGHRRNPGTTADLVAATLFAALRERQYDRPWVPMSQ